MKQEPAAGPRSGAGGIPVVHGGEEVKDVRRKQPRQLRSRETVDVLLEAAAQVFTREGLAATTNRIAERAGVSIGSLYQYFPNKYAMLRELAERHFLDGGARLDQVLTELRATEPPFEETMHAILDVLVELHQDRPALHALLHRVNPRLPGEFAALAAFEDYVISEITYHLERCDRGGADPTLTASTLVHAVDAQLHRVLTRHSITVEQLTDLVLRLLSEPAQ